MKILAAFLADQSHCPRALRIREHFVEKGHRVEFLCFDTSLNVELVNFGLVGRLINFFLLCVGMFDQYLARKVRIKADLEGFDHIICHDLLLLPVLTDLSTPVVFDAREYYSRQFEDRLLWRITQGRLADWILRNYLSRVSERVTVSAGLAAEYERSYGYHFQVILGRPRYYPPPGARQTSQLKFVYIGNTNRNRGLTPLCEALALEPSLQLHLYLHTTDQSTTDELLACAAKAKNISVHKPVPFTEIVTSLADYDVGIFVSEPSTINLKYCMPNKLFEYCQARLLVLVSPLPELAAYVKDRNIGYVCDGFSPAQVIGSMKTVQQQDLTRVRENVEIEAQRSRDESIGACYEDLLEGISSATKS